MQVSTHSRLKAAGNTTGKQGQRHGVSTHSRLKAAGPPPLGGFLLVVGFNTQPPEGGWLCLLLDKIAFIVSTHSRLKAAGIHNLFMESI